MSAAWSERRPAVRLALRQPLYNTLSNIVLGVAMGSSSAMLSILNAVVLRQLPCTRPRRPYISTRSGPDGTRGAFSIRTTVDLRERHFAQQREVPEGHDRPSGDVVIVSRPGDRSAPQRATWPGRAPGAPIDPPSCEVNEKEKGPVERPALEV